MALMQDKEFDRAIRQKLESLSPAVPKGLWERIETALDRKDDVPVADSTTVKGKRMSVNWLIAASVIGICCIGWWMSRPVEVIYLRGKDTAPAMAEAAVTPGLRPAEHTVAALPPTGGPSVRKPARTHRPEVPAPTAAPQAAPVPAGKVVMLTEESEIPHAALYQELTKVPLQTSIARADEKPAATKHLENVPVLVPADAIARPDLRTERQLAERRPFGVSSLLNIVVGAVDNRQDKIITFTEDSEGTLFIDFNRGLANKKK